MKLNPEMFAIKLRDLLFNEAVLSPEGSSRQAQCFLGASLLEQGKKCPRWIATYFAPRAWQDAYGAAAILNGMNRIEIEAIFNSCIEEE
jgi:hypothetical protein